MPKPTPHLTSNCAVSSLILGFLALGCSSGISAPPDSAIDTSFTPQNLSGDGLTNGPAFQMVDGLVAVEAESFHINEDLGSERAWSIASRSQNRGNPDGLTPDLDPDILHWLGASNESYVEALPDTYVDEEEGRIEGLNYFPEGGESAQLCYRIEFSKAGDFYVHARAYARNETDSHIHVGLDGSWPPRGKSMHWSEKVQWTWSKRNDNEEESEDEEDPRIVKLSVAGSGSHLVCFAMSDDGFELDKFILTDDPDYDATGEGPSESPRVDATTPDDDSAAQDDSGMDMTTM